jgi:hypothetical protein
LSYTVSAENILYGALIERKSVSIPNIRYFTEVAQTRVTNCYFDISAKSIFAVLEAYSDVFKWKDDQIELTDYYKKHIIEIKEIYYRRLPHKIISAFENIEL